MKKTFSLLPVFAVSLFLLSATCKKEDAQLPDPGGPGGPNVLLPTSGYLLTMGRNADNHSDTMTYYFHSSLQELTVYGHQFLRDQDEVSFENNSNGTVSIKKKIPHVSGNKNYQYFGIEENTSPSSSIFPLNKYLFDFFHEQPSILTQFIIHRKDGERTKFTIESKAYPGYYLGCAKWQHATYPTTERFVFTTTPAEFWFTKK